jgi:hypothetical protein
LERQPWFQYRTLEGERVTAGETSLTPVSRALVVRLGHNGFVWNRPVAVLVEEGGVTRRLPVVDYTRWILWGLAALGLLFALAARPEEKRSSRRK